MIHLTPQQLSSYMDGELNEVSTELVRRHMGACEECTLKFAALEEQEEQLSAALVHEPGDEFFDRFAAEVERQLPPGKEPVSKRGSTSPAKRAAALREAARDGERGTAREVAMPVPFPTPEAKSDRPSAAPPRAPVPKPAAKPVAADEPDFDEEAAMAAHPAARSSTSWPGASRRPPPEAPQRPVERAPSPRPARHAARPVPRPPKIRRPTPSIPWYAAMILAVIAGAAGVVVSRTDPVSAWLDTHGLMSFMSNSENPAAVDPEPAPGDGAPSGDEARSRGETPSDDSETSAQDDFEPEPQAATWFLRPSPGSSSRTSETAGGRDPFSGLPPNSLAQVRVAQRSKAAADATPSAARYEAAAAEWERAIPLLRGLGQQSLGRLELASSRYRAWENAPTEDRATAAAVAIRTYLALAPQGAPREVARNWLARVSR
jgi:hypothetical protein